MVDYEGYDAARQGFEDDENVNGECDECGAPICDDDPGRLRYCPTDASHDVYSDGFCNGGDPVAGLVIDGKSPSVISDNGTRFYAFMSSDLADSYDVGPVAGFVAISNKGRVWVTYLQASDSTDTDADNVSAFAGIATNDAEIAGSFPINFEGDDGPNFENLATDAVMLAVRSGRDAFVYRNRYGSLVTSSEHPGIGRCPVAEFSHEGGIHYRRESGMSYRCNFATIVEFLAAI